MIKAKRIYEPKKDDNFDVQKVLGEAIQKSITSSTDQTKQLVSEFERMSSDAGVKKLEEKFYQYIKNLRIEKEEIKQDVYKSIEQRVQNIGKRIENHSHKEYLTQEDKEECINSATELVNEAVLKFDNLFKPLLEQIKTKAESEHSHEEFGQLQLQIDENEEELEHRIEQKADKEHKHEVKDVMGLSETLNKYAKTDHKHDEYATREELSYVQRLRSGGGGAHVIQDNGVVKAQRSNMNFIGATVTDDPQNNATVVTVTGSGTSIALEVEGTPNVDQTKLNLKGGTNVTITDNGDGSVTFDSSGGGGASSLEVTQVGHGFVAPERLYFDDGDSTYKKAQADDEATLGMWHVVEVVDADTFKIAKDGVHPIANALAVGEYVLSPTVAGGYTQTIPGTLGDLVLYGMEVLSATEISFYTVPAIRVGVQLEGVGTVNEIAYWIDADTLGSVSGVTATEMTDLTDGGDTTLHTHDGRYYTETEIDTTLGNYQLLSEKGVNNGYAELDSTGKVPSSQLPAYVDDVVVVVNFAALPGTGETGKIYVTEDTNLTYRWNGSGYTEISASLALGETSSTAYRGDRGKTAYDHSQLTSGNPHNVTKTDVGLSNVVNADTTTTANITDSSNKRFVTDAQEAIIDATSGTNTGDQALQSVFDLGQTIVVSDTENQTLTLTQNDVTNNPTGIQVTNAGTGAGIRVDQTGAGTGLRVDNASTQRAITINQNSNYAAGRESLLIYSNTALTTGNGMAYLYSDNASSTIPILRLRQDGSGTILNGDAGGTTVFSITNTGAIELGHASDTTISRVSAGRIAVEGVNVVTVSSTDTLTNKTLTSPTLTTPVLGTPSSGNLSSCTADGTNAVGFLGIPVNSQSSAYTTVLSDAGKCIYHPSSDTTARTWTIDSNANVAYPIGTAITFANDTSAGVITIAITSDTLVLVGSGSTGSRTLAANGQATAHKVTATRWRISGIGLT